MKRIAGQDTAHSTTPEMAAACAGQVIQMHGFVHKVREMHGFAFVVLRCQGTLVQCMYESPQAGFPLALLTDEMPVLVTGRVRAEPRSRLGWELDLLDATPLSIPCGGPPTPLGGKALSLSLDTLLDLRPATLRHPTQQAIFAIQAALAEAFATFLCANRFMHIDVPRIVSSGAEGGANVFALDYFGQQAYLAQSPQLYKQMMVGVFERVYAIGPVFRAEKHDTARHLNEYTSVDVEMGFIEGFEDIMQLETRMLRHAMDAVAERCDQALALLGISLPEVGDIPSIRFSQAKALLPGLGGRPEADSQDLQPEEERLLCRWAEREAGSPFLFVTHYPSAKRPFYAMDTPDSPAETESFDLLFRGLEITTGGQRIHTYPEQAEKMERLGMSTAPFESFLMAHRTGLPPHGGFGLGLERLTAQLLELPNVRQATLFPRDKKRLDP